MKIVQHLFTIINWAYLYIGSTFQSDTHRSSNFMQAIIINTAYFLHIKTSNIVRFDDYKLNLADVCWKYVRIV